MTTPDLTDDEIRVLSAVAAEGATGDLAHAAEIVRAINLPSAIDRLSALGFIERPLT
jgi:hypothetical protein